MLLTWLGQWFVSETRWHVMQKLKATTLSSETIDRFLNWLEGKGRSPHTIKAYRTDLLILLEEVGEPEILLEELEDLATRWIQFHRRTLAPKTTARRMTSLRRFAEWTGMPGRFLNDISAPTPAQTVAHPIPEGMDGIDRLVAVANNERHKALVALLGYCGCRISEALSIRPSSFNLQSMMLLIHGKGDKYRSVPLSERAWEVLSMPVGRAFVTAEDAPVVGLNDRFARRLITELGERAKLKRRVASHDLRATLATHVYDKTRNMRLVAALMGHADEKTSALYVGVDLEKMREGMQ